MGHELHLGDEVKQLYSRLIAEGTLVERGTANPLQNQEQSDSCSWSLLVNKNTMPRKKNPREELFRELSAGCQTMKCGSYYTL